MRGCLLGGVGRRAGCLAQGQCGFTDGDRYEQAVLGWGWGCAGAGEVSDRVKLVAAVSLIVGFSGASGVAWGWAAATLSGRVWLGVLAGVAVWVVASLFSLGQAWPILPWKTWTVTVWFPGGSKSHLRTVSLENARKVQRYAQELSREQGGRIEARITKGRRGL